MIPTRFTIALAFVTAAASLAAGPLTDAATEARLHGGLVVLVGASDATIAEALKLGCTVQCLDRDPARTPALRARLGRQGVYGRVTAASFDGRTLPYVDNLINLLVREGTGGPALKEIMRVLVPRGTALVQQDGRWVRALKEWPAEFDEWNQYLHDADNNGVSADTVGPPTRLKWVAGPRWGRSHMSWVTVTSTVTSRGRLFTVEDLAAIECHRLPARFHLVARDAFNGCELWRRPLSSWAQVKGYVKFVPTQIQRQLAAIGDRVFCTLGYDEPISAMDAATGAILTTYAGTERTREFAVDRGVLFAVVSEASGSRNAKSPGILLKAVDAETGRTLWQTPIREDGGYIGGTLAVRDDNLAYCTRTHVWCCDSRSGRPRWKVTHRSLVAADRSKRPRSVMRAALDNIPPTLVLDEERLYCSTITAVVVYALADGRRLWEAPNTPNYMKSSDLFLAGGLVWTGLLTGHDRKTGEVRRKLTQQMTGPMGHDRCYRNRITESYYINSKSGGADFVSLSGDGEFPRPWVRGTCGLGVLPANGHLYSSPFSCSCCIGTMLTHFTALYCGEDRTGRTAPPRRLRLIKGPAYGGASSVSETSATDWPTYRHDTARSGRTGTAIRLPLTIVWTASLPSRPTAATVAAGLVFVAAADAHTLFALSLETGQERWRYTAGGRIDSPPTFYRGFVLFGSRDGCVTCLRAGDGEVAWEFSDLPAQHLIADHGQFESAWPVSGSVLVRESVAYFAAGRNTFLDGGIVVYGLDALTGSVRYRRRLSGPYDERGFPVIGPRRTRIKGGKGGIFLCDREFLYLRHLAFRPDLTPVPETQVVRPHLIASSGFLHDTPQHRTYWTIDTDLCYGPSRGVPTPGPQGDILAVDGDIFYEVRSYLVGRHSLRFDPRKGTTLFSGRRVAGKRGPDRRGRARPGSVPRTGRWEKRWATQIPLAGHALAVAGDTVLVAGPPLAASYGPRELERSFAGALGGRLWAAAAADGRKLAEVALPAPPVWDGIAAANGKCIIALKNGAILCLEGR